MLSEYKDEIGVVAGALSIVQLLSPSVMCKDIVKSGSSTGMDVMPFLGGFAMSLLFLQHALLMGDPVMLNVNLVASGLNIIYLSIYYTYTKEKGKFYMSLSKALIFVTALIGYAQWESADVIKFRFGIIITLIIFALISAPLLSVGTILKTRNTDPLPMPLIISGTVVTVAWFFYGVAIDDAFLQIQNVIAFFIQVIQIGVFVYVKLQKQIKKDDKKRD